MDFDFELHEELKKKESDSNFIELIEAFKEYKRNSEANEIAAPTRHTQENMEPVSPLFGRDRFFKNPEDARRQELYHLHVFQEKSIWFDGDSDMLAQWECKSDSYLIYSYFKLDNTHYFYIIAFLDVGAHKATKDLEDGSPHPVVLEWLKEASDYKKKIEY